MNDVNYQRKKSLDFETKEAKHNEDSKETVMNNHYDIDFIPADR